MNVLSFLLSSIAISLSVGCKHEEPQTTKPKEPVTSPTPSSELAKNAPRPADTGTPASAAPGQHRYMARQYSQAHAMKSAVIQGDLVAFRQAAALLATQAATQDAPESWQQSIASIQLTAKTAVNAQRLDAAAEIVGQVGQHCAACHAQLGGPSLEAETAPESGAAVPVHMARHQWAADTMWDGLIAPSSKVWVQGADAMAISPLHAEGVAPATPEVDQIAHSVHHQANAARLLPERERGSAYARFIATCAACHQKTGVTLRNSAEQ